MGSIFLQFTPKVAGESQDDKHKEWIEIQSFAYGISNPSWAQTGSGASGGQATFSEFNFTKVTDKATAALMLKAANGQHFDKAEVICYKAGGEDRVPYLTLTFEQVYIASYSTSGAEGAGVAMESISCSYGQVKQKYTLQDDKGGPGSSTEFGWNVKRNTAA